jgi:hypothetical protein
MAVKVVTSCYFPLFVIDVKIEKTEVKEASGIQYILLSLIKNAQLGKQSTDEKICDVLDNFGVPKDLLPMFSKEMLYLIKEKILDAEDDNSHWIEEEATIGDFDFTELGEKLFKDKAIPTNQKSQIQKKIYFDPIKKSFSFGDEYSIAKNGMENSSIKDVKMDVKDFNLSRIKDFVEDNKSKLGIKTQEQIVSTVINKHELAPYKVKDCLTIEINESNLNLTFAEEYKKFANEYFSGKTISKIIAAKSKFQFPKELKVQALKDKITASDIYLPSSFQNINGTRHNLVIGCGEYDISKIKSMSFATMKTNVLNNVEYITFNLEGAKAYSAANVLFKEKTSNLNIQVPIIIENVLNKSDYNEILVKLYEETVENEFSFENIEIIRTISSLLNDETYLINYINDNIVNVKDFDKKITNFKIASNVLKDVKFINQIAQDLLNSVKLEITLDNLGYYRQNLLSVKNAIGLTNNEYIESLIANIQMKTSTENLFTVMLDAGFTEDESLPFANTVLDYSEKALKGDEIADINKLAHRFSVIANKLKELKLLLGVNSTSDYTINEEYVATDVENNFRVYKEEFDRISRHKNYAKDNIDELEKYYKIFIKIYDFIIMEKSITTSPDKITKKQIEQKLNNGRLQDAIITTAVVLERVLHNIGYKGDLFDMINNLYNDKIISENDKNQLHDLRMVRNNFAHGLEKNINYELSDVREWIKITYQLKMES